jgi:hypothetical protein
VVLAAVAAAAALAVPGDWATATQQNGIVLRLHFEMTCGQPGRGSVDVTLPRAFSIPSPLVALVGTRVRPARVSGHLVSVQLPPPPEVTCMSIGPGVVTVTLRGIAAPPGTYLLRATLRNHAFTALLRIR